MLTFLSLACVLASVTSLHAAIKIPASRALREDKEVLNKSLHFVNVIKQNLRRNNDDYDVEDAREVNRRAMRRRLNDTFTTTPTTPSRPFLPISDAPSTPPSEKTTLFRSFTLDLSRGNKHVRKIVARSKAKHGRKIVHKATTLGSQERQLRVARWKQILEKSKRLHGYTSSPKIEPSSPVASRIVVSSSPTYKSASPTHAARASLAHIMRTPLTTKSAERPEMVRAVPDTEQLDMAPARGAIIQELRLKGRFCYRHVLWPEGPKYDSKGNIILPAFNSKIYKKDFDQTTRPRIVLPRCCNCCRKSVLGCD